MLAGQQPSIKFNIEGLIIIKKLLGEFETRKGKKGDEAMLTLLICNIREIFPRSIQNTF